METVGRKKKKKKFQQTKDKTIKEIFDVGSEDVHAGPFKGCFGGSGLVLEVRLS